MKHAFDIAVLAAILWIVALRWSHHETAAAPDEAEPTFVATEELPPPPTFEPIKPQPPQYPPLPAVSVEKPVTPPEPVPPATNGEAPASGSQDLFYTPISDAVRKMVEEKAGRPPVPTIDPASIPAGGTAEPPRGLVPRHAIAAAGPVIHDNLETAKAHARTSGRRIVLVFTQAGCAPCRRLKDKVIAAPDVAAYLREHDVLAVIDCDAYPRLADSYQVFGLPTAFILNANGSVVARFVPSVEPEGFLAQIKTHGG